MNQKRSQRLEALYDFALDLPTEERSAYLAEACGDDAELRNKVESLLAESEPRGDLLSKPILTRGLSILAREQVVSLRGDQLGPYKIVKLLGCGGMGEVYLAQDPRLGRLVAIKLLPTPLNGQGLSVLGLEQEARAASSVSHPNVAHIYEIGEADGHRYIAMEYVEGDSLRALLSRKVLSVNEAVEIALQITNALGAAHAVGIVHRDIKPENIIVRSDGYVKVLDFGLAQLVEVEGKKITSALLNSESESMPRVIMGTTAYMSPEQVQGEETDARTDFWSLGVVLYEMLTGERPFVGETPNDIATAILTINPQPLKSDGEPMASLALITQKALTKSINARYQTAVDFAKDLNRIKQYLQTEEHVSSSTNRHPLFDSGFGKVLFPVEKFLHLTHSGAVSEGPRTWISWGVKAGLAGLLILIAVFAGIYVRRLNDARSTSPIPQTSGTISQPNLKIRSLVILPFQNDTGDDNFNYVTNGLTEDVSRNLSRSQSLIVIDRYSAEQVSKKDFSQIKQLLDVDAALQCRIGIKGSELVIQPNLVNLDTGEVIWQNSFTVGRDDLLGLRKLLTGMLTINLQGLLGEDKAFIFDKHLTKNPDAYNVYLEGRYFADKHDINNLERSIPLLEKATQLDPDFALAYVALGNSYNLLGTWLGQSPDHYKPKSQDAILKAISLDKDKTLAEAHTALAKLKMDYDHDWTGAEEEFRRAIEINPGYALAHHWYGEVYLSAMGRLEESLTELQLAHRLDPLHTGTITGIAWTYIGAHQYEKAIEECRKAQALDSPDPKYQDASIYENWAKALMKLGRFDEAISNAKKACEIDRTGNNCAKVGAILGWAGRKTEALMVLRQLQNDPTHFGGVSYYDLAIIEASLGEKDKAFELLDKEFYSNSVDLLSIKIDPMLDSLRDDPRFTELERRYNFPPNNQAR